MSFSVSIRFFLLILAIFGASISANVFSVNYLASSEHPQLVNADTVIKVSPSALHIADLYTRLSGNSPILAEERENVASIDPLSPRSKKPILLEVHEKGKLSSSVHPIVHSTSTGPSLHAVLEELKTHGIEAEGKTYENTEISSHDWITQHSIEQPVIILHHNIDSNLIKVQSSKRRLKNSSQKRVKETDDTDDEDTIPTLTEFEISQYQICLWTAVGFILLVGVSVCSIAQMEVIPDSLLYAKFQTARSGGRTD